MEFLLLSLVTMLALAMVSAVLLSALYDAQVQDSRDKVRSLAEAALGVVKDFEARAARGEMPADRAREMARNSLRAMRYGSTEYIFANEVDGNTLVNGGKPEMEGKNLIGVKDPNGVFLIRELIAAAQRGGDFVPYSWPKPGATVPSPKLGYALPSPDWKWMVGTGVYVDNIEADFREHALEAGLIGAAVAAIRDIGEVIGRMNAISSAIAAAIEEQGAATRDIAGNIQQAAHGARAVSSNITGVNRASEDAGSAARQVLGGAGELADAAERLRGEVGRFLSGIRVA